MQEIFISYRHVDTGHWAASLTRDLVRSFGQASVFLDQRDESLPWGSLWSTEIARAATHCEAMLVLMGAQWIDCRSPDGQRRLLAPDDPVRHEVQLGLQHGALVLPVLFEGGRTPTAAELPSDLVPLLDHQFNAVPITDFTWEANVGRLVGVLAARPPLRNLHDLCTTRTGIARLRDLIESRKDVLLAVARSSDEVRRAAEQIRTLRLLKDTHDALHAIEHQCLEPMRVAAADADLSMYELNLAEPAAQIHAAALALGADSPSLPVVEQSLNLIADLMRRPLEPTVRRALVEELEHLISSAPDAVDGLIKIAATSLKIDDLVKLLGTVREALPTNADADPELAPLIALTQAIEGLNEHLRLLVREHGQLQALDMALRFVCRGSLAPEGADGAAAGPGIELLRIKWRPVELQRQALAPPYSVELPKCGFHVLQNIEDRLRAALDAGDGEAAWSGFQAYFEAVGKVFWTFNSRLKAFCNELDDSTNPLRAILSQLESSHG